MEAWKWFYKNDAKAKSDTLKTVEDAIARRLNNERPKNDTRVAKPVKKTSKLKLQKPK